jgi:hypothetical protein
MIAFGTPKCLPSTKLAQRDTRFEIQNIFGATDEPIITCRQIKLNWLKFQLEGSIPSLCAQLSTEATHENNHWKYAGRWQ